MPKYNLSKALLAAMATDLLEGRPNLFLDKMSSLYASVPYYLQLHQESQFHTVLHTVCVLLGLDVQSEVVTSAGRIDMLVTTPLYRYVFEFKLTSNPTPVLEQVLNKQYLAPFMSDTKRVLILTTVYFSTRIRNISGWVCNEITKPDTGQKHYAL